MKKIMIIIMLLVLFTYGCDKGPYVPDGAVGVHELSEKNMEGEVKLYGQVTMKGVAEEGCFELTYVGKNVNSVFWGFKVAISVIV